MPKNVVPRKETFPRRCSQEADAFGMEMSLGRCRALEGNIPGEDVPSKVSLPWEDDVLGKDTSLG